MSLNVTAGSSRNETSALVWLPLAGLVLVADQLAKWAAVSHLTPYEPVPVLPPWLDFTLMYNTGTAFGLLEGVTGWLDWLLTALALFVSVMIVRWLAQTRWRSQALLAMSGALVLGGALGNVLDRIRAGRVVDFIDAHWAGHHFWTFNVADSAITAGVVLYLVSQFLPRRTTSRPALESRSGAA